MSRRPSQQLPSEQGYHSADGSRLWDRISLQSSLAYHWLSAWLTCYLAGWADTVSSLDDSRFPPSSSLWDYALVWGSHMATWIQTRRCPRPQGCLFQLAALGSCCCSDFICQIPWAAVTLSGWTSLFCLHMANFSLGFLSFKAISLKIWEEVSERLPQAQSKTKKEAS